MGKLLAFLLGLIGLAIGSQAMNFTTLFSERLDERLVELEGLALDIEQSWEANNLSRDTVGENCVRYTADVSTLVPCLRDLLIYSRYEMLASVDERLNGAAPWERPILLGQALVTQSCQTPVVDTPNLSPAEAEDVTARVEEAVTRLRDSRSAGPICVGDIARRVADDYVMTKAAVPTSAVGIIYTAGGFVLFWVVFRLIFAIIGLPFRQRYAY
ncbi:hypothetical protein PB2503_06872 [Parvularcula bermudensis HTCC2503]|uniref:Uncharacterized protein n=1 Tax=Parvularcula bermudensis (strain ATCC BAA-594 / HTCC2503 / KCTC 12087) TaxID=314260 RepID=E0TDQ4_PARBH|nr:hypothetical protein [Parvularcula bermudensis]ADM09440.1 hypothetical protein PB2503_06872 [Parvularcula bermudensis HTCC2503]